MNFALAWRPVDRSGVWIGDPECVEMMQAVDEMPPEWRALVHEYGGLVVREMYDDGTDVLYAEVMLEQRRERKQAEWFATDFITPAVVEGFKRHFRQPLARAA